MSNEILYEMRAENQTTNPRILTDSQTTSHELRIVCLSGFIGGIRNAALRICGSTVVIKF
jgi:hypothetical protein